MQTVPQSLPLNDSQLDSIRGKINEGFKKGLKDAAEELKALNRDVMQDSTELAAKYTEGYAQKIDQIIQKNSDAFSSDLEKDHSAFENTLSSYAEDLARRCERSGSVTHSAFLTPAESFELQIWARQHREIRVLFHGGAADCERRAAFFLPDWLEEDAFDPAEYLCAMKLSAYFGEPGHRDYMGAVLGMGIGREWLGDIRVEGSKAYVFCMPSVLRHLLGIEKVGRVSVKAEEVPLSAIPAPKRQVKELSFSVMSMRLDAVAAGMFNLSRTACAKQISEGNVSLNYSVCMKTDAPVGEGDVISLRGHGKGTVSGLGGNSRKGRQFVEAEILI
jgi:RNA-binding protein YlmH